MLLAKPCIEMLGDRTAERLPMFSAPTIDMVNSKKDHSFLATTCAFPAIGLNNFASQFQAGPLLTRMMFGALFRCLTSIINMCPFPYSFTMFRVPFSCIKATITSSTKSISTKRHSPLTLRADDSFNCHRLEYSTNSTFCQIQLSCLQATRRPLA
mgnify:CR=1 FL=1